MHLHRSLLVALAATSLAAGLVAGCGSSSQDDGGGAPAKSQPSGLKNGGNATQGTKKG